MKKILILLCLLPYLLPAQNIVQADTLRAKYGFSMGVTPTRITVREITKVVNAASTHLQLPTAKAVWDAITANVLNVSAGSGISISGTPPNITVSATDVSNSNEGVLGVGAGGSTSTTIVTNTSGGNAVTINVAGPLSIAESTSSNGGSITITGTGAEALSGVVNQVPYFNTTSTITTEAGSGTNSFTWDATNNRLGIGTATLTGGVITGSGLSTGSGATLYALGGDVQTTGTGQTLIGYDFSSTFSNRGTHASTTYLPFRFNMPFGKFQAKDYYLEYETSLNKNNRAGIQVTGTSGAISPALTFITGGDNVYPSLWYVEEKSGSAQTFTLNAGTYDVIYLRKGDNRPGSGIFGGLSTDKTYNDAAMLSRNRWEGAPAAVFAKRNSSTTANIFEVTADNLTTKYLVTDANGLSGFGTNSPQRRVHVEGEARITDLTTDTPTRIVGADADGDLGAITVGSGLSLSGGTLSTSGGTSWLLGGNTLGAANTIGSNDNFDVSVETNGSSRLWVDNTGPVTVGSTVSTAAALVVNGLQSNTGFAILGGTGLVAPAYISTRGDGSGTTAQVLDSRHSMIGGTVATIVENTATTLNSNAITSLIVNSGSTGDPYTAYTISGGTQWVEGIDNSDADKFKVRNASTLTTTNTGLTLTTNNFFGVNQNAPSVTAEFTGTDGIVIPQGTTAQRPSLTGEGPVVRYNQNGGSFELGDHNKNNYFRLTGLSSPSVAVGGAAGTGATVELTSGAGSNDCSGSIDLTTGTSTGVGTVLTLTYFEPYNGATSFVMLNAGNDVATTQCNRYSCQSSSNTTFTIRAVTALDASTTYRIKYLVRAY